MTPLFDNEPRLLLIVLVINTIVALLYGLWRQIRRGDKPADGGWLRCIVMILTPIVGVCMFLFGFLFYKLFLRKPVDLEDVIFSKQRVKSYLKADEDRERDFVPLEEAIAVTDKTSTRTLMMEVVRRDITHSLSAISLALNSEDSEVSHYAASVLRDTLGTLRNQFQQMSRHVRELDEELQSVEDADDPIRTEDRRQLEEAQAQEELLHDGGTTVGEEGEHSDDVQRDEAKKAEAEFYRETSLRERTKKEAYEQGLLARDGTPKPDESIEKKLEELVETAQELVENLFRLLQQKVLSTMEQRSYTEMMDRAVKILDRRHVPSAQELEAICQSWLQLNEVENCRAWIKEFETLYPKVLGMYLTLLKLSYAEGDREAYFATLDRLKNQEYR